MYLGKNMLDYWWRFLCWPEEPDESRLVFFLLEWDLLSFDLEECEPFEVLLLPEVSSLASLLATFKGDSSSEVELSGELVLVLIGL